MKTKNQGIRYPSARLKGLEEFMAFVQEPGWKPSLINIDLFKRLGMAKGKEGLAVHTLKFIGVIDEAGIPTEEFDNLKKDHQSTLNRLVQASYAELFSLIPP